MKVLSYGQLDAGFAALAGFVAGFFAVRNLSPDTLGVYGLIFLAFSVASQLPAQLIFGPAEVLIAHRELKDRFSSLHWSLRRGLGLAAIASIGVLMGPLPFAGEVDLAAMTPLMVTAVAFTFLSPIQDHIRKVLHTSERSERAAGVSAVNLISTVGAAFLFLQFGDLWVPFGSMAVGNAISIAVGVSGVPRPVMPSPALSELLVIGRHLIVVGLGGSGGRYLAAAIVGWVAGPAAVGFAEAARLVARPIDVFSMGLLAVVGPRVMVATAAGDEHALTSLRRVYYVTLLVIHAVYIPMVVSPSIWGLPAALLPNAYQVGGLVLVTILANLVGSLLGPPQAQLLAERKERNVASAEIIAQIARVLPSASSYWIGSMAIPVGDGTAHGLKLHLYRRHLRR